MHDSAITIHCCNGKTRNEGTAGFDALKGLLRCSMFCGIVLLLALIFCPTSTIAAEKKNGLILNPDHQGFTRTDEMTRGAVDALRSGGIEVLGENQLPEGSVISNEGEAFQKVSNGTVLAALAGIAGLGIVVLVLVFNIGERRRTEQLLRGAHDQLELKVAERTHELSTLNRQLSDANWRLAEANEALSTDMAKRLQIEAELQKSQKILSKIFEANPDHLVVIDRNLRILHSNWLGGFEYVPEESRGHYPCCFETYNPGQGTPCNQCPALEVFATKKPVFREMYNARIGFLEIRAVPIFDDQGAVLMVAEHIRDITERKKIEEELLKAQKLESLGVLAGGIAHDFNNLLTGIMGNISLVKMYTDPKTRAFLRLGDAERACERAADLTQQLITFAKGGEPVKKPSSIAKVVRAAVGTTLRGARSGSELVLPDNLWVVLIDEAQMRQVIGNLVANADQAMVDGGTVFINGMNMIIDESAALPLVPGRYVRISIRDHGSGISPEHLPKIFDPYFTTKEMGNGLGLAAVYSIVKNHQGHLAVESEYGVGTVFYLYLPAADTESETKVEGVLEPAPVRILVMDDEVMIRETSQEILSCLGFIADACPDGTAAVDLYRKARESGRPYAAVIMDLTIPGGKGGKEVMGELLEIDPDVKGIVSSGYNTSPVVANYREYGFSGVVSKPYSVSELQKVLRAILDEKGDE